MKLILHLNVHPNNQSLKNEVAITLHLQLCSARYTVLQTKNNMISVSAINPLTMEIWTFSMIASQCSHREAVLHYHESTPSVVSEDTKE